jgi:hypothetical protein
VNRIFSLNYIRLSAFIAIWGFLFPKVSLSQISNNSPIPYLRKDGKYSLVNQGTEQRTLDTAFDWIGSFHDNMAKIEVFGDIGYINQMGKIVVAPKFLFGNDFSNGRAKVSSGTKYGFIDTSGKLIIPEKYDAAGDFKEGMAAVRIGKNGVTSTPKASLKEVCFLRTRAIFLKDLRM